ncbi:hypothetical protein Dcar01_00456 [Deinococcus carri]|uniref:FlgD Ig-like domain-containing protein n=1 Tax=Deinococcus carri TaxID=1211323 RepID=A0ABP9W5F1_9DEIO
MQRLLLTLALGLGVGASAQVGFRLDSPGYRVFAGEKPVLTLTVTNGGREAVPLPFSPVTREFACPAFKVFRKPSGQQVDPLLPSLGCHGEDSVRLLRVQPGQSRTLPVSLPTRLGVGEYRVQLRVPPPGGQMAQYVAADLRVLRRSDPAERTPWPLLYRLALKFSHAQIYGTEDGDGRLTFNFVDDLSRAAFMNTLRHWHLDARRVDLRVAPAVRFPANNNPYWHASRRLAVTSGKSGYTFTLTVTNRAAQTLNAWQHPCDPVAVERFSDSVYVFQQGNGPCPTVGHTPVPLQPGQSATRRFQWDGRDSLGQPVPSGQYRVRMAFGQVTGEAVFTVK